MTAVLFGTFYVAMVMQEGMSWNCTMWLNIAFLILAAALVTRFVRTGGVPMLRMMGGSPEADDVARGSGGRNTKHGE